MEPSPDLRRNVLRELKSGTKPIDVARKFRLSLVTVGEIASAKLPAMSSKPAQARSRRRE